MNKLFAVALLFIVMTGCNNNNKNSQQTTGDEAFQKTIRNFLKCFITSGLL